MDVSVILPTHNPDAGRLRRTLAGLRAQTLPADRWETLLIDNACRPPVALAGLADVPANLRVLRESRLGLTAARRCGFTESQAPLCVLVDDDNLLAPDYLAHVIRLFAAHPLLGAIGGRCLPEFEREPAAWKREFLPLLALRDPGDRPQVSQGLRPAGVARNEYPVAAAPIGAGMALRREAARQWMDADEGGISDRRGDALTSGGDNDIVLAVMRRGWEVAYFPELSLTHLIPASRLEPGYLARLNRGIQQSWMQVLSRHDANPWPAIEGWTVPLRQLKAWFTYRAWSGPAARIRWQGACGHFEGRIARPLLSHAAS
jgi:glycosyltransferase involved in cell wall biosynthesis